MVRYLLTGVLLLCFWLASGQLQIPQAPVLILEVPDVEAARRADASSGLVPRFALPVGLRIESASQGHWAALPSGGYTWQLTIQAPGATALIAMARYFPLPAGARLQVYNDRGALAEQYFHRPGAEGTALTIGPHSGEQITLEYFHPTAPVDFVFEEIFYGFTSDIRALPQAVPEEEVAEGWAQCLGFGCSLPCQVNVNCLSHPQIQRSKNSAVRILMLFQQGASWCSGALVNNVREDGTPYILSAFHCQFGYTPFFHNWAYFFNYEGPECSNPLVEPVAFKVTGSEMRAKWQDSDFLLLEMTGNLPTVPDITFAGWNRADNYTPSPTFFIHHPSADIKKVSVDSQAVTIWLTPVQWFNSGITTPGLHHYRLYFDLGTSEGGSSGGPLFDMQGRIIGQLNGGSASCSANALWFGRIQRSWNGGGTPESRLRDWLDPDNTGAMQLSEKLIEGISSYRLSGRILTPNGLPVPGVRVTLSGQGGVFAVTGSDGRYTFPSVPAGQSYTVSASRDSSFSQGISVADIVLLNKFLVGTATLPSVYAQIAADVNGSGHVTISDLLEIRKLLLGIVYQFSGVPSWTLLRTGFPFFTFWQVNSLLQDLDELDFIAVKNGDVNQSVQP